MQRWVVICWALLALVGADDCPDGRECEDGHACCSTPAKGYECCPLHQAECCEDHVHCCPEGTVCDMTESSCVNATVSIPWLERVSSNQPRLSKSFRMIRTYMGEEDDNICPDQSRCPPEFSCLRALTRFGCCPLAQGITCSDGKHCCPEGLQCSADSRSCIQKELVSAVMCSDGESECPEETTCCETPDGSWGCCPMPKAVCCEDKTHCCPEGSTCDVKQSKCVSSSTKKEMPMLGKLPARRRAEWENQKEDAEATAQAISDHDRSEKVPEFTTVNTVPPFEEEEVSVSPITKAKGNDVPCNDSVACEDGTTCCKNTEGGWACCPLPQAVCCDDHIHCCPDNTTCDPTSVSCQGPSGSAPMVEKLPAFTTVAPGKVEATTQGQVTTTKGEDHEVVEGGEKEEEEEQEEEEEEEEEIQCDSQTHTTCPQHTTCCFMASCKKWGCCPLPEAVCCSDGDHCCPTLYTCDVRSTSCHKGEVVIPWYNKLPATTSIQSDPNSVECDAQNRCPEHSTCCQLFTGQWGCCPLHKAVCCPDREHCCPQGYSCNLASGSCQKLIMLQLQTVPLTRVYVRKPQPQLYDLKHRDVKCDDQTSCKDGETCCRMSSTTWGCCPFPNAVCCSDMAHCCPNGFTCEGGGCSQNTGLRWDNWHVFLANKKRALVV